jgi:hypothetical protein
MILQLVALSVCLLLLLPLLLLLSFAALQISPHILIHWRPDAGNFKAFLIKQAPKGARATPGVNMTVLPSIADQVGQGCIDFIRVAKAWIYICCCSGFADSNIVRLGRSS